MLARYGNNNACLAVLIGLHSGRNAVNGDFRTLAGNENGLPVFIETARVSIGDVYGIIGIGLDIVFVKERIAVAPVFFFFFCSGIKEVAVFYGIRKSHSHLIIQIIAETSAVLFSPEFAEA